jgi:polysaccharide export outer membrane protein
MLSRIIYSFAIFCVFLSPSFVHAANEYTLAVDDLIKITVYDEPDLTLTARISSGGFINYPLLGKVEVKGLTAKEVEALITEKLEKDYLVNPQVTVNIKEYSCIYVLGEVEKPGPYKLSSKITVMQAVDAAGGFTELANRNDVVVKRTSGESKEEFKVNLSEDSGDDIRKNDMELQPDDIIRVNKFANVNILGEVNNPGQLPLKNKMTVIQAITLAGGFTKIASPNRTRVIRTENGTKKVIKVQVDAILKSGDRKKDFYLQPNDVIIVPESIL